MATKTKKKVKARALDFTNVRDRSQYNSKHVDEGDYIAIITGVEETQSKSDGEDMWVFAFQLEDMRSAVYPYYCKLDEDSLWKIRNILEAAGITVPKRKANVDPTRVVGKRVLISLQDDEYEGKPKSVIQSVMSVSELDGDEDPEVDDDEDDEPPARKSKARKKAREPEPEEDDEEDEVDESDEDEDDEPEPPKSKKRKRRVEPEDDDDDEEEDEPPVRKRKKTAAASKKSKRTSAKRRPSEEDEDEMDEMDIDDL